MHRRKTAHLSHWIFEMAGVGPKASVKRNDQGPGEIIMAKSVNKGVGKDGIRSMAIIMIGVKGLPERVSDELNLRCGEYVEVRRGICGLWGCGSDSRGDNIQGIHAHTEWKEGK